MAIILKKSKLGLVRLQQRPDGLWSVLFTCEGTGRTPWTRVVLDKLLVDILVKKFFDFSGTPRVFTPFTTKNIRSWRWK